MLLFAILDCVYREPRRFLLLAVLVVGRYAKSCYAAPQTIDFGMCATFSVDSGAAKAW